MGWGAYTIMILNKAECCYNMIILLLYDEEGIEQIFWVRSLSPIDDDDGGDIHDPTALCQRSN